jgi:hypothetical protein
VTNGGETGGTIEGNEGEDEFWYDAQDSNSTVEVMTEGKHEEVSEEEKVEEGSEKEQPLLIAAVMRYCHEPCSTSAR